MKCIPNTTNLHTHGLHIDPAIDTIFESAGPGESLVYYYSLPSNHASGLHWYHAHKHGSSTMQIMGGLFGALVVANLSAVENMHEPLYFNENLPESLSNPAKSHILVISQMIYVQATSDGEVSQGCGNGWGCDATFQAPLCTAADAATESPFSPFRMSSYQELSQATLSTMNSTVSLETTGIDTEEYLLFVNGQYKPSLAIYTDSSALLHLLIATGTVQ